MHLDTLSQHKKMMLAVTKTTESGEAIRLDAESILHESTVCRSSLQEIVEFATNSKTGCVSFFHSSYQRKTQ